MEMKRKRKETEFEKNIILFLSLLHVLKISLIRKKTHINFIITLLLSFEPCLIPKKCEGKDKKAGEEIETGNGSWSYILLCTKKLSLVTMEE